MKAAGVRRVVTVSAAPVPPPGPADGALYRRVARPLLWRFLGNGYRALQQMERILEGSGLDWTVIRPPVLGNRPRDGRYRTATDRSLPAMSSASRANLADAMLQALEQPETVGKYVAMAK